MPATIVFMLIVLPLLLIASAFFSGSETALFSLSRHQRALLARGQDLVSQMLTRLLAETRPLLITLLLSNMTVNVVYFVISSVLMIRLNDTYRWHPVVFGAVTLLPLVGIILFGEVLPKLLAAKLTLFWARFVALPMYLVHRVLAPLRITCQHLVITPLARLVSPRVAPAQLLPAELESLLTLSERQGVIDSDEEQLLQQVMSLSRLRVRDLMVPRVDVIAHNFEDDPAKLVALFRERRVRCVPVYRQHLDSIMGVVYARQALLRPPRNRHELGRLIRRPKFVPEQQRADQLLVDLRKSGATIGIVVDEYGGTAGLVALKDVVEAMIGDIPSEDQADEQPQVIQINPGQWEVTGNLAVREWSHLIGGKLPTTMPMVDAVSTLGGLIMACLGRVPKEDDELTLGNLHIRVLAMSGPRVARAVISLRQSQHETSMATDAEQQGGDA